MTKETTHFGYETVSTDEKAGRVKGVFDSVAPRYDFMNDLMSGGLHRLWKRYTIDQAAVKRGQTVLDLAGGTGDLAREFAGQVGATGHVVLADINASMLVEGRSQLIDAGVAGNLSITQVDAEVLPFSDASFDCITIAFGLRNVTNKDAALRSMLRDAARSGRPGRSPSPVPLRYLAIGRLDSVSTLLPDTHLDLLNHAADFSN